MNTWRRVDREWPGRPYLNLAYEEALAKAVAEGRAPPTLRFWRNHNTVVLGRHQCADLEVNYDACERLGVRVVRRFTGGGAVYHDQGNLNYTLVLPQSGKADFLERHKGFEVAATAVTTGLRRLGVDARFEPINDIHVGDQKISGLAGTLTREALLYHGCLLVSSDLSVLGQVLRVAKEKLESRAVRSVRKQVTTLVEVLGGEVDMEAVKDAITEGVRETFGVEVEAGEAVGWEVEQAETLVATRYTTEAWNLGPCLRCPCRKTPDERFLTRIVSRQ